jgi:hypothetical protein
MPRERGAACRAPAHSVWSEEETGAENDAYSQHRRSWAGNFGQTVTILRAFLPPFKVETRGSANQ